MPIDRPVDVAALTRVRRLGAGGQGEVWLVEAPDIFDGQLAFKSYLRTGGDFDLLRDLVGLPDRCGDDPLRTVLDGHTAWPLAIVRRDDAVCGFLMRPAPDPYVARLTMPSGPQEKLLGMEFLLNPVDYMTRIGLPVTDRSRVLLLRELARLLKVLHPRIVVGDLSPKNVLVALEPPGCFLLDCDAMRIDGRSVLPQVDTPGWEVPDGEDRATRDSDRYKFGLLAVRLLLSDDAVRNPHPLRLVGPAHATLADLVDRSLREPPGRPDWDEWLVALDAAVPLASSTVPTAPPAAGQPASVAVTVGTVAAPPRPHPTTTVGNTRRTKVGAWWAGALGVLLLMCLASVGAVLDDSTDSDSGPGRADPTAPADEPAAPSTVDGGGWSGADQPPANVGMVTVNPASTDPATIPVAQFFDTFFRAVNAKDWSTLLGLYDPAGVLDPRVPKQRDAFIEGMSSTQDGDVQLLAVNSGVGSGQVTAEVTFVSTQAAGKGPRDRPAETCTRWTIVYRLTPHPGGYRMLEPETASNRPC